MLIERKKKISWRSDIRLGPQWGDPNRVDPWLRASISEFYVGKVRCALEGFVAPVYILEPRVYTGIIISDGGQIAFEVLMVYHVEPYYRWVESHVRLGQSVSDGKVAI